MDTPDWDLDPDTLYAATPDGTSVGASPTWYGLTFTQATGTGYGGATVETEGLHKIIRSATDKYAYYTAAVSGARPETVAMVVTPQGNITGYSGRNGATFEGACTGVSLYETDDQDLCLRWPDASPGTAVTDGVQHVIVCVHSVDAWTVYLDGVKVMTQAAASLLAQVHLGICGDLYRAAVWDAAYTDDQVYDLSYELANLYDPIPKVWDFDPLGIALDADLDDGDALSAGTYDSVTFTGTGWTYDETVGDTGKPGMVVAGGASEATVGTITRAATSTTHVVVAWDWESVPVSPTTLDFYEETGAAEEVHFTARLDDTTSTWRLVATNDAGPTTTEGTTRNYAQSSVQLVSIVTTVTETSVYLNAVLIGVWANLTAAADIVCTLRNDGADTSATILRAYMVAESQTTDDMEDLMAVYDITGTRSAVLTWSAPAHTGGAILTGYMVRYGFEGGVGSVTVGPGTTTQTLTLGPEDAPIAIYALNDQGTSAPAELTATSYVPPVF